MDDKDTTAAVEAHLKALDEELARLRRMNDALESRTRQTQAEIQQLGRIVAESAASLRPPPVPGD